MPDGVGPTVHVHRHPHAFVPPLSPLVTAHWSIPVVDVSPHALTESIDDALAHIAACLPREDALVLWESAARRERLSPEALRQVRWKTVAARDCAEATTGLSDSGLETIVVVKLSPWGVPMRQQTVIAGRPVDLLIGERLVIQFDGFAYHSSAADRRRTGRPPLWSAAAPPRRVSPSWMTFSEPVAPDADLGLRQPAAALHQRLAPGRVQLRELARARDEGLGGVVFDDAPVFHHEHPVGDRDR